MNMTIQEEIKLLMRTEGITYRYVAEKWGCTFQNVYQLLNNRTTPAFYTMRRILNTFFYDFEFVELAPGALDNVDQSELLEVLEDTEIAYAVVEKMLTAMKIGINIVEK